MQEFHLLLINSKPKKALSDILNQKDNFLKTLSGMNSEEQCLFIKDFMITNKLLVSINKKLPLLFVYSNDAKAIVALNHPTKKVLDFMMARLIECLFIQCCSYKYYNNEGQVLVFTYDKPKLSAVVKNKLKREKGVEKLLISKYSNDL